MTATQQMTDVDRREFIRDAVADRWPDVEVVFADDDVAGIPPQFKSPVGEVAFLLRLRGRWPWDEDIDARVPMSCIRAASPPAEFRLEVEEMLHNVTDDVRKCLHPEIREG